MLQKATLTLSTPANGVGKKEATKEYTNRGGEANYVLGMFFGSLVRQSRGGIA